MSKTLKDRQNQGDESGTTTKEERTKRSEVKVKLTHYENWEELDELESFEKM